METLVTNKKAYFDYEILEKFEAGIVLSGIEIKAAKTGKANLSGSFAIVKNNEAYILNLSIAPYQPKNINFTYIPDKTRKLLLHKKQITYLLSKKRQKNLTLIPLRMYNKNGLIKIELGLAKGKKKFDKRETLKKKEIKRKIDRAKRGDI
ncbi:MAG: SsrA-binding protein SmpB [Candidatus Pacebacteria bacterium]|jgi:SsrA-binding protein|nr:SsrA-binding protein SmpB [Candidatus Paceibacterota bacterium]MDD4994400.1 SsrA-binding protein SmpB [Candidatus Paceibacterota bacterium]MDD5535105.1 SsrA-binding protein SmpB [Candidatus Paceibacterota bacterium]